MHAYVIVHFVQEGSKETRMVNVLQAELAKFSMDALLEGYLLASGMRIQIDKDHKEVQMHSPVRPATRVYTLQMRALTISYYLQNKIK